MKESILLSNGTRIKRVVKHTMLGNWSFPTIILKSQEYHVEKISSGYKLGKKIRKKR